MADRFAFQNCWSGGELQVCFDFAIEEIPKYRNPKISNPKGFK